MLVLGLLGAAVLGPLIACGPFFPNSLLQEGDNAVLQAPTVSFRRELDRLQLTPPPRLVHVPSERDLWPWPLTGLATGAVLGWLHVQHGGVLGPIVAHLCWELSGRFSAPPRN